MARKILLVAAFVLTATGLSSTRAAGGDVNIGISIGAPAPPPPLVVAAPPTLVPVPGTVVYQVPSASFNLFVYAGRYYSFHNSAWFYATNYSGPWTIIATERVPKAVIAVPVTYYKIPPGQAKKMSGPPWASPGHGRGPHGKRGWKD